MTGLKEWLLNKFAQKDGDYVSLNSGTANDFKKIEGEAEEGWLYRKCPQDNIGTGARLEKIKGKTLVWNQLVKINPNDSSRVKSGITIVDNRDGSYTVSGTAEADVRLTVYSLTANRVRFGHKFLLRGCPPGGSSTTYFIGGYYIWNVTTRRIDIGGGAMINDNTDEVSTDNISITVLSGTVISTPIVFRPILIDLTQMFGAGNEPSTVDEFEALYPNSYYAYNAGTLISNDAVQIETVGFNQLNVNGRTARTSYTPSEDWTHLGPHPFSENEYFVGYANGDYYIPQNISNYSVNGGKVEFNTEVAGYGLGFPMRVVPGTNYFIKMIPNNQAVGYIGYYDVNGQFISGAYKKNNQFTTPANCYWIILGINSNTLNQNIVDEPCINLSNPAKNGTYEPYWERTLNLGLNAIKVNSQNIWDEKCGYNKRWDNDTGELVSDYGRLYNLNPIPVVAGAMYYAKTGSANIYPHYYDGAMNYIGQGSVTEVNNRTFTVPAGACYMNFHTYNYEIPYNNDICINISSSFNGQYEPHGDITFTGGLKSAGTVYDEIDIERKKYIKRIGEVDMGTLTWDTYDSTAGKIFRAIFQAPSNNLLCAKYVTKEQDERTEKCIYRNKSNGRVDVIDSSYNDAASFKTAMSGVMLYYELETPVEYDLVDAIPCITQYSEYGTQRIISPQSSTPSAPFMGEWQYGIQQRDFISGLENSEFTIGSSTYIISEEEFNEIFGNL